MIMTTALQEAFQKAAGLPLDQQEALAAILMEEMADESRWQQSFARSQNALSKLAAEALAEDAEGRTLDMDESL
jgi:hypothetical protein